MTLLKMKKRRTKCPTQIFDPLSRVLASKYVKLVFLKQKRPVPISWTADRVIVLCVLVVGLLILVAVRRVPRGPDRCPIDGHVAEWTKRSGDNSCGSAHFSAMERTPHTWSAACP